MNKQNVEFYVDKVLIGLNATIFCVVYNRLSYCFERLSILANSD